MHPEIPSKRFDTFSFLITNNLVVTKVVTRVKQVLGYACTSIENKSIINFIEPNCHALFFNTISTLSTDFVNECATIELQLVLANNVANWFSCTIYPIYISASDYSFEIYATNIHNYKLREAHLLQQLEDKDTTIEALQSAYQINEAIVNNSNAIIITIDVNDKVSSISKFTEELIGYTQDEVIGKDPLEVLLPQEYYPQYRQYIQDMRAAGEFPNPFEGFLRTKSGEERVISWMSNPLILNGKNIGRVSIGKDVTEVKNIEQELIDREKRFRKIAENIPLPISISNTYGQIIFLNKKFLEIIGYTTNEIPTIEAAYQYVKYTNKAAIPFAQEAWENSFSNFKNGVEAYFPVIERIIICKDGTEKYFEISFSTDENVLYTIYNNITDKVLYNESLKKQKDFYETILNNIPSDIAVFDSDHKYLFVNPMAVANAELRQWLIGKTDEDYCKLKNKPLRLSADRRKLFNEVKDTKILKNWEEKLITSDGRVEYHLRKLYPVLNEAGDMQLAIGYAVNITDLKQAQDNLIESEQRFKALAENMPIAIGSHHIDGDVMFINKYFIETVGYTNEDIPTLKDWYLRTQPNAEIREKLYGHWLDTVAAYRRGELQSVPDIETSILCKNGLIKTFSFLFSIYKDVVYIMLVDITERKKAEKDLLESHSQLRELASHLQKVREEERKYIAREIHDELGQLVTGLKMDISITKKKIERQVPELGDKLVTIMEITDDIIHTVRRIASELRPSILDDIGLDAALEWLAKEFEKRTNIQCKFMNYAKDIVVSMDIKSNLFRIFQESLTNIIRHANAKNVEASLILENKTLIFSVVDNGDGFKTNTSGRTFGLLGMKERVIMINGTFEINSEAGRGTEIIIKVPII